MNKILAVIVAVFLVVGGFTFAANAAEPEVECVPRAAYTETINHPAVTIKHPAVYEDFWANWAPNETQGPQNYTPIYPDDERGKWIKHSAPLPGHTKGQSGVYQTGSGNSSFFYVGKELVKAEYVETVKDAWTETIDHPAVTCDEEKPVTTPDKPVVPKKDPVVKTKTTNTVDKTIKVHTLKSGKKVREVIEYKDFETFKEEGF